ncbi:MAG: DNA polymerase I, partial [Coriobacteriaceae bacterium]|nr:DNA polymerase I [Coriobacteriaceae bacterium]
MTKKIAVLDGNSLMHRAYHAVPPTMSTPDGTPTHAVFGFISMLLKFIDVAHPDAIVCAFDVGRPQFRIEALSRYKAQRPPMDDSLRVQFPLIEDILQAMGIPVVKVEGWEGDDILGTIAARNEALGFETLLVTGDKDAYQLASDLTQIVSMKKGISDIALYGPDEVFERYGIRPNQVPDYLGLKGDSSDNIPGVPGIGEKTATKLLQSFGSLEGVYDNIDKLKGRQQVNVRNNKEAAFVSRMVATIRTDLDFPLDLEDISFPSFSKEAVQEAFGKLRFTAHLGKVLGLIGATQERAQAKLAAEPLVADPAQADAFVTEALAAGTGLGVAWGQAAQASLFDTGLHLAVNTDKGTALFEGDHARQAFARIVREGSFAAIDVKRSLKQVYPADTAEPALIGEDDLFTMDAFDLGIAGYVLDSSADSYSVADLMERHCNVVLPEAEGADARLALQAAAASALRAPLAQALEKDGSIDVYRQIDGPLIAVLALIERTGAAIDVERLRVLGDEAAEKLNTLRVQIYQSAGMEFNIDSPKQLSHILFEVLGLKPQKKTQTGFSTNATVLKELAGEHELPDMILSYREMAKIKSTYIDALPRMRAGDGRVHTSFNGT